ncbi:MAG: DUF2892 domain-containing protein [Elusimicrobiota bacterium]|jgi:hypothetical protein
MDCNVGGIDRVVRVLVGIILTALGLFFLSSPISRVSALVVAALCLVTAWFGFCYINKLLGVNTAKRR